MKVGPAVAVAGGMMVVEVVTAPEVLDTFGALVFVEHAPATAMPTTAVTSSPSSGLPMVWGEAQRRFIGLTPYVTSTRRLREVQIMVASRQTAEWIRSRLRWPAPHVGVRRAWTYCSVSRELRAIS